MLKGQARPGSKVGDGFICSVRAFGGFKMNKLGEKLDFVKNCIKGYYQAGIVSFGTNDLISDDFEIWHFMDQLKELLLKFQTIIECKHVLVLGFMPRAYCRRACKTSKCLYIHKGHSKKLPIDFNVRVNKVNYGIDNFIRYDTRFKSFKFLNFCPEINKLGTLSNSFDDFLSLDGLHLSDVGNEILDTWIYQYLSDMTW